MKRVFWAIFILSAYLWSVSTGRDQFMLDQGKKLYQTLVVWFEDAEVDFQIQKTTPSHSSSEKKQSKRSRRWD